MDIPCAYFISYRPVLYCPSSTGHFTSCLLHEYAGMLHRISLDNALQTFQRNVKKSSNQSCVRKASMCIAQ